MKPKMEGTEVGRREMKEGRLGWIGEEGRDEINRLIGMILSIVMASFP